MLSDTNNFKEIDLKSVVVIQGIPKDYFVQIIQYIYSDHFYPNSSTGINSLDYYLNLLIYSDYFLLKSLTEIISQYIGDMVQVENVIQILLISNSHNAKQLFDYCIKFICIHER